MEIGPVSTALRDFRRARRKADLQEVVARLTGRPATLISFEEVRQRFKVEETGKRTLQEIPLDAIVGSVGRYKDFTRKFLPRLESDKERWTRVKVSVDAMGLQPIDVYQVGKIYFVLDGHHRVSVAKQIGAKTILANVIEVHTKVPLSPEDQLDDLIIAAEYADFLEHTHLDQLRPKADMKVTAPGRYQLIEEQIQVYGYILSQEQEIPYEEVVTRWYDEVYTPVVQVIRERGILREFPGRTEADLYLWVSKHRQELVDELGWRIDSETASADLVDQFSSKPKRVISRVGEKIMDAVLPDEIEAGPRAGKWHQEREWSREKNQLFADILVAITGRESGWRAVDQGIILAKYEGSEIHGVHIVSSEGQLDQQKISSYKDIFTQKCISSGIEGDFAGDVGKVPRIICRRARWTDLVVISLSYPPAPRPISRLSSGLSTLIRRCPRPILAVPGPATDLERPLVAYDGSPKAEEALFIGAHISSMWNKQLVVVNIQEQGRTPAKILAHAKKYLDEQGSQVILLERHGQVASQILNTAREYECDLIMMGGYGFNPFIEIALGSVVDEVLRCSRIPVLICR
jgi:nucleotide-binding universal stress UspA family protein